MPSGRHNEGSLDFIRALNNTRESANQKSCDRSFSAISSPAHRKRIGVSKVDALPPVSAVVVLVLSIDSDTYSYFPKV